MFKKAIAKFSLSLLVIGILITPIHKIHAQSPSTGSQPTSVTGGDPEPSGDPDSVTGGDPEPSGDPDSVTGGDPEPSGEPDSVTGGDPEPSGDPDGSYIPRVLLIEMMMAG